MQPNYPRVTSSGLKLALSVARWRGYRNDPDQTDIQVLSRYLWNMALSAALQPALHVLEVTLRNALFDHSSAIVDVTDLKFDKIACWLDATPTLLTRKHANDVEVAKSNLSRQKISLTPGHVIASLGFGFWTGLFDSRYDHGLTSGPKIWPELARRAFPNVETIRRNRHDLSRRFYELPMLRNRIAHLEPVWKLDVETAYYRICETIGWMNASAMHMVRFTNHDLIDVLCAGGPEFFADDARLLLEDGALRPTSYS